MDNLHEAFVALQALSNERARVQAANRNAQTMEKQIQM